MRTCLGLLAGWALAIGSAVAQIPAQAFYGRAAAYDAALGEGGDALAEAVRRNVFGGEGRIEDARAVAAYIRKAAAALESQAAADLVDRGPVFPQPEGQPT